MKLIVKRSGHSELYNPDKLYRSVFAVCLAAKEPEKLATSIAKETVEEVSAWLKDKSEVTSNDLRRMGANHLKTISPDISRLFLLHRLESKHKPIKPSHFDYDLAVIGTGAGGTAAHMAVNQGKKVAVVEEGAIGGECPNYGCVPTKALLYSAEIYYSSKHAQKFGINGEAVKFNYPEIKKWKDVAVWHTGTHEGIEVYKSEKIRLIKGHGHFLNPWTLAVAGRRITARNFIIASGTYQVIPPIPGLEQAGYLTYREAIDLTKPPKSLFVLGGGPIGCEFAELFSSFGTEVTIGEAAPRLVCAVDPEAGELIKQNFEKKGVKTLLNSKVTRVSKSGNNKTVHYERNGRNYKITVEEILVATGKGANTDLGLENAGVKYTRQGIRVNSKMQTRAGHIYAAGDCVGPYRFTHTAAYQSRIAANNILHREKHYASYDAIPWTVFTEPEVAGVGLSEAQLVERKIPYQIGLAPVSVLGRAHTSGVESGFVKVLADKKGRLLGATVACPRAGEVMHELALAVTNRMKASQVVETIHAFPTWSEGVRLACAKIKS